MNNSAVVRRDKTMLVAVLASIIIHALMMMPFVRDLLFKSFEFKDISESRVIPMEFELVSPPQKPTPSKNLSKYLSTVSSRASDELERELDNNTPHGEGPMPFADNVSKTEGAESGGQSELPPLPKEESDLGEALRKSKFLDEKSPRRELSLPERNIDFNNPGSTKASIDGISLNTTAWDFAPYLLNLKHRIKQHWIPPLAFTALGAIHGYTWVRFRIMPDGRLESLEVVDERGHESLTRSSVGAVRGGAPFRSLPADFPEPYLEITFGFYYLLPGDEREFFKKE